MLKKFIYFLTVMSVTVILADNTAKVGYIYPSGGQRGTTFRVIAGGQKLNRAAGVYISGKGVRGKIIGNYRLRHNLNREQRILVKLMLEKVRDKRIAELPESIRDRINIPPQKGKKFQDEKYMMMMEKINENPENLEKMLAEEKVPDNPMLHNLDEKNLRELTHVTEYYFNNKWKKQRNQQLSELVEIEITIDTNAVPGNREMRLKTALGMSNPMIFQVNNLSEKSETEPNNLSANQKLPQLYQIPEKFFDQTVDLPVILNGQIMPGDVDRFRFKADKGQKLIIEARARELVPYLADAVPGWFQAVLTLYNSKGKKLAFTDDYRFNPDPVLYYTIPKTDEYEIEIRDAIYRGRSDFIYRIKISEDPFITQIFPLGGQMGVKTESIISGYNLPETNIVLNTKPGSKIIRQAFFRAKNKKTNPITYAVNNLPECNEKEPNNFTNQAQKIKVPKIINGRIGKSGDIDVFKISCIAGEEIVVEVNARVLNSPLNSLLRLVDEKGKVIKWNDDYVVKDKFLHESTTGLITHHSDSYLTTEIPETGTYYVQISDALNHGGKAYAYRLRVSNPQPDFTLLSSSSTLNILSGTTVPLTVYAIRKEGFTGPIKITVKNNKNLKISGGTIQKNCNKTRLTLTTRPDEKNRVLPVRLIGKARIKNKNIFRQVIPADNTMQAFLYRHLVSAKHLALFSKASKWKVPTIRLTNEIPVKIKSGSDVTLFFKASRRGKFLRNLNVKLDDPPEGISITNINAAVNGFEVQLHTDKKTVKTGKENNLILAVYRKTPKQKNKKGRANRRNFRLDTLPAVPIEIIE